MSLVVERQLKSRKAFRGRPRGHISIAIEAAAVARAGDRTLLLFPIRDASEVRAHCREGVEVSLLRADDEYFLLPVEGHASGRILVWESGLELRRRFANDVGRKVFAAEYDASERRDTDSAQADQLQEMPPREGNFERRLFRFFFFIVHDHIH